MLRPTLVVCSAFLATAASAAPASAAPPPLAGKRVLVLGDSITQDGRYVSDLVYYVHRLVAGPRADVLSLGLGSETLSGLTEPGNAYPRPVLSERLARALEAVRPEVVVACYGMNDGIYHPADPARHAAFAAGLRQLADAVHARGASLILVTPPVFDVAPVRAQTRPAGATDFGYGRFAADYDDVLAAFAREELALAGADVAVIDLHTAMRAELAARRRGEPTFTFSPDGVHPGDLGHLLIARVLATGLGLPLPEADLEAELTRLRADPLHRLISRRRALRSEAWLAFVGYTRGPTFHAESVAAAEAAAAHLQDEIEALAPLRP